MCAFRRSHERVEPGPGQESVWDYPRPPKAEATDKAVQVVFDGKVIADTRNAIRVLETSHPPVFYIPSRDVRMDMLQPSSQRSWCEWKGEASYFDLVSDNLSVASAAWTYLEPHPSFEALRRHIAFYPSRVEACYVEGEKVRSQDGDFYGGWITSDVVGPFKGAPGTHGW